MHHNTTKSPQGASGSPHTDRPEGYDVPVNLSLTQPVLMGGVPRASPSSTARSPRH